MYFGAVEAKENVWFTFLEPRQQEEWYDYYFRQL